MFQRAKILDETFGLNDLNTRVWFGGQIRFLLFNFFY